MKRKTGKMVFPKCPKCGNTDLQKCIVFAEWQGYHCDCGIFADVRYFTKSLCTKWDEIGKVILKRKHRNRKKRNKPCYQL